MYRANLYQKNIATRIETDSFAIASGFNNALVEISNTNFKVHTTDGLIHNYKLEFLEDDFATTTYVGKFENERKFRLILPKDFSLEMMKNEYNALGAFTLGTINPSGWALLFILTEKDDIRNVNITEKGNREQIQRLIDGSIMAINAQLVDKFVEFSKRLLPMIENDPSQLRDYQDWYAFVDIMKAGLTFYTPKERNIILSI